MGAFSLAGTERPPCATAALQVFKIGRLFLHTCALHWRKEEALIHNLVTGQDTEVLRHLWRLAFELQVIPMQRYEAGAKLMHELGRQVGGWLRSREGGR